MATGNMFRKPRSTTRQQSPMQPTLPRLSPARMGTDFWYGGQQTPNLQTSMQRPTIPNPIAPAVADAAANARFNQMFPNPATSSFEASQRAAGRTANNAYQSGMSNQYSGLLNPMGQDTRSLAQREQAARANAAFRMGGGEASDPTNLRARFGAGSPLVSQAMQAAQARADRAAASDKLLGGLAGSALQNQNMLNPMYSGPFAKRDAQGDLAYTNRQGAFFDAYPELADPSTREAALTEASSNIPPAVARAFMVDQQERQRKRELTGARAQKFKDEHGGMSARQFGIQQRADRRANNRYRAAVMQGLNPMSPQAQALFPGQTEKFMEQRQRQRTGQKVENPMAAPTRTLEGQQRSAANVADMAANNPSIAGLGVDPNQGLLGLHTALGSRLDEDPNLQVTDEDLKSYQRFASEMANLSTEQNNQFDFGNTGIAEHEAGLWRELTTLPDDPAARQSWLARYRTRKQDSQRKYEDSQRGMTPLYRGGPYRTGV